MVPLSIYNLSNNIPVYFMYPSRFIQVMDQGISLCILTPYEPATRFYQVITDVVHLIIPQNPHAFPNLILFAVVFLIIQSCRSPLH